MRVEAGRNRATPASVRHDELDLDPQVLQLRVLVCIHFGTRLVKPCEHLVNSFLHGVITLWDETCEAL
jgi:hypothetical protein